MPIELGVPHHDESYILVPEGEAGFPDVFPPYLTICSQLEEAQKEREWVTGPKNQGELDKRIEYLAWLKKFSPEANNVDDANRENYSQEMSFSPPQREFLSEIGHPRFHALYTRYQHENRFDNSKYGNWSQSSTDIFVFKSDLSRLELFKDIFALAEQEFAGGEVPDWYIETRERFKELFPGAIS